MYDTQITITRPQSNGQAAVTIAQHVTVQVDQQSDTAVWQHNRNFATDYRLLFKIITYAWNPTALILAGDVLVDEHFIDPDTGAFFNYRVEGTPKNYVYSNQQLRATLVPGTE